MARRIIDGFWDRENLSNANANFEELYEENKSLSGIVSKLEIDTLETLREESKEMLSEIYNTLENPPVVPGVTPNIPVSVPDGFSWITDNPIVNKVFTDGNGKFSTTLTASSYKASGGNTYYVDKNKGSSINDGLSESTPVAHLMNVLGKLVDGDTVIIAEGRYFRYNGATLQNISKSINLIGKGNVEFCIADEPSWTKTSGHSNVYELTRIGASRVVNFNDKITYGVPSELKKVTSISEVDSKVNSWYTDGTKVYVNIGAVPTNAIVPLLATDGLRFNSGSGNLYIENIDFYGGHRPVRLELKAHNIAAFKKVGFFYSTATNGNGLEVVGGKLAIIENCRALFNVMDGFNYHIGADGSKPGIIEINSVGYENGIEKGTAGSKSNNGSTIHDGLKGVRVNGVFGRNDGGNVADVNVGTESWNLGVVAFESYQNTDFLAVDGAKIWIDYGISYGTSQGLYVDATSTAYVRKPNIQTENVLGTKQSY